MHRIIIRYISLAFVLAFLCSSGRAVELITNGGFETGVFAPWTAVNVSTNVWYNWRITTANCDACLDAWTNSTSPHSGTRSAWNGWAAGNPVPDAHRLYQDITIPNNPADLVALRWWDRLQWNLAYQAGSTLPQYMIVNIRNPTTNALIAEKYRLTAPAASQGPMNLTLGTGWVQHAVNLSAYKGQSIRVEFQCTVAQNTMGPGICEFDDVSVTSAVPSAAMVSVSGRATSFDGRGVAGATVSITDSAGAVKTAITSSFGYYQFDNVEVGSTYIVSIGNKRYLFPDSPRIVSVNDQLTGLDFVASP